MEGEMMSKELDKNTLNNIFPSNMDEIRDKMKIEDKEKIEETLKYCESLLDSEEQRKKTLESKATSLTGITGLASSVIFGFAGFIFDKIKNLNLLFLFIVTVLYTVLSLYIIRSIYYSIMALKPEKYVHPDANDIFQLSNKSIDAVRKERAISSFYSYVKNIETNNQKGNWLLNSQRCFRNSIIVLALISVLLGVYVLISDILPLAKNIIFCIQK